MKSAARRHIAVLAVKMVILFPICPTSPEVTTWFMLTSIQLTFLRLALTKIKSDFTHSFPFHLKAAMFLLFLPLVGFLPLTSSPIPITTPVHLHVKEVHVYLCATNFTALNPLSSTFTDCCMGPSAMALPVFSLSVLLYT